MGSEIGDIWKSVRAKQQEANRKRLESADDTGWKKHTEYHWSRQLNGLRLDYWPSKSKFQYQGRVMTGNVNKYIRRCENKEQF